MSKQLPPIQQLLNAPDKGKSRARGIFSRLFRDVLDVMEIGPNAWNMLMIRYLDDPTSHIGPSSKDRSTARGNINKELARTSMSGNVFIKALRFIRPDWIRFEVHIAKGGEYYVVGLNIHQGKGEQVDQQLIEDNRANEELDPSRKEWFEAVEQSIKAEKKKRIRKKR